MNRILFPFAIFICFLFFFQKPSFSMDDSNLAFLGKKIIISYLPVTRSPIAGKISSSFEIGRLNLLLNVMDNYLIFLEKIGKTVLKKPLSFEYLPSGGDANFSQLNRIPFSDLGINALLEKVNTALMDIPQTSRNHLLTSREALMQIKDQLPSPNCFENEINFFPVSLLSRTVEPDIDFAPMGDKEFISVRPDEKANHMMYFDLTASLSEVIASSVSEYRDLLPSPDGKILAFTEAGQPRLFFKGEQKPVSLLDSDKFLLEYAWSPKSDKIAGMVRSIKTAQREIFCYDIETRKAFSLSSQPDGFSADYQFAFPFWSPDGKKIIFTSGKEIHLLDIEKKAVYPNQLVTTDFISEILWSPDSRSFAFVEVNGQSRDRTEFDSLDFPISSLRRICVLPSGIFREDMDQKFSASGTIKILSFWTNDRILFLEGNLTSQKISRPYWDLKETFKAHLTPESTESATHRIEGDSKKIPSGFSDLPIAYCYAFKNLDSKFKNIYDSGLSSYNYLFSGTMRTLWFVGISAPAGFEKPQDTFNLRPSPFPFPERNIVHFCNFPNEEIKRILDNLDSFSLRAFTFSKGLENVAFLSNSCGPLTLWYGSVKNFAEYQFKKKKENSDEEKTDRESASNSSTISLQK
ncbi:MAG: PD40 domain-containing protein [Candidatus Riflebacteria bacterium]|nr:PD40 domain-containing protein [Candidatus Riflebacteria bacterium]